MNRLIVFLLVFLLPAAAGLAGEKKHIETEGQECSECHADQAQAWLSGTHGIMNVKCVVCHGSTEGAFVAKPGDLRCRGCHGELVAQAMKMKSPQEKNCFPCHDHHTLTVKPGTKTPFHAKGGNQP